MKKIVGIVFVAFTICLLGVCIVNVKGKAKGKIDLKFSILDDFTLTNAEGKKFVYHPIYNFGGNIKIYKKHMYSSAVRLEIDDSSRYIYKSTKEENDIRLMDNRRYVAVRAKNTTSIIFDYVKNTSNVKINGAGINFEVATDMAVDENHLIFVNGKGTDAEVFSGKNKIVVKNVMGVVSFEISNMKTDKDRNFRFLPTSSQVTISNLTDKNPKIIGGILLDNNVSKKIEKLRAMPVSRNKVILNFNRVKGAKGYVVYRYDESSRSYKQIGRLKGNKSTLFQDNDIQKNKVYRYKVSSYKKKKGKKKESKMSYEVSAIISSKKFGNATKVTLNKSGKRELKKGKSLKLKAKITGEKGKKLVSKDIRWCSKNKKVAVVDKKGRVKALKKGVCKIHAKAHNGKNSKAIIIKVV